MSDTPEKILTLHPEEGKSGVNIDKDKYEQVKAAAIEAMKEHDSLTPAELFEAVTKKLEGVFDGKIGWYTMSIKLDLEARKIIEHNRKTRLITLCEK